MMSKGAATNLPPPAETGTYNENTAKISARTKRAYDKRTYEVRAPRRISRPLYVRTYKAAMKGR